MSTIMTSVTPSDTSRLPETVWHHESPRPADTSSFSVAVEHRGDAWCGPVLVQVAGPLDHGTTPQVVAVIRQALTRRPPVVVLEVSKVTAVNPASLSMLVRVGHLVALCDGRLRTLAKPEHLAFQVITAARLNRRLELRATVEAAFCD